ncbi:hypothetical protein NEOKW01_1616 [Nematocida sp. AWRm80]|nr:hypothetical protein NEOKW01_1616 [Nematocida sp. AWRm80]
MNTGRTIIKINKDILTDRSEKFEKARTSLITTVSQLKTKVSNEQLMLILVNDLLNHLSFDEIFEKQTNNTHSDIQKWAASTLNLNNIVWKDIPNYKYLDESNYIESILNVIEKNTQDRAEAYEVALSFDKNPTISTTCKNTYSNIITNLISANRAYLDGSSSTINKALTEEEFKRKTIPKMMDNTGLNMVCSQLNDAFLSDKIAEYINTIRASDKQGNEFQALQEVNLLKNIQINLDALQYLDVKTNTNENVGKDLWASFFEKEQDPAVIKKNIQTLITDLGTMMDTEWQLSQGYYSPNMANRRKFIAKKLLRIIDPIDASILDEPVSKVIPTAPMESTRSAIGISSQPHGHATQDIAPPHTSSQDLSAPLISNEDDVKEFNEQNPNQHGISLYPKLHPESHYKSSYNEEVASSNLPKGLVNSDPIFPEDKSPEKKQTESEKTKQPITSFISKHKPLVILLGVGLFIVVSIIVIIILINNGVIFNPMQVQKN